MITFFSGMFCCRLSLSLQSSMDTSFLLKDYFQLDPRVRLLGAAFRFWARQVKVEGSGGLPPHAISLLLVSFLQKQAVLPVIPAIQPYNSPQEMLLTWKSLNKASAAELWVELFRWLALGLRGEGVITICGEEEKTDFKGKRLTIEDPFATRKNLCCNMSQAALDHFSDCCKASYLYFGSLQTSLGPIIKVLVPNNEPKEVDDDGKFDEISASVKVAEPVEESLDGWLAHRGTTLTLREAAMVEQLVSG